MPENELTCSSCWTKGRREWRIMGLLKIKFRCACCGKPAGLVQKIICGSGKYFCESCRKALPAEFRVPEMKWTPEFYDTFREFNRRTQQIYKNEFSGSSAYYGLSTDITHGLFCLELKGESYYFRLDDLDDYRFEFLPSAPTESSGFVKGRVVFTFCLREPVLSGRVVLSDEVETPILSESLSGEREKTVRYDFPLRYEYPAELELFEEEFLIARLAAADTANTANAAGSADVPVVAGTGNAGSCSPTNLY